MNDFKLCKVCSGQISLINEKYNLGECNDCKLIFCLSYYSQDEFVEVYNDLYNSQESLYQRHTKDEFEGLLLNTNSVKVGLNRSRLIKRNILNSKCKSVLEIGSGIGLVGAYVRSKDEKVKYLGIEIDNEAYKKSKLLNLNTINGDFKEIENLEETFDVIMMWEVIEHLQDLNLFLQLAHKKLNVNGKLILSTPNYNKIYNYPERKKDQLFQNEPPIHLNFFTSSNIINIFELHHFKDCRVVTKKFPYLELKKRNFYINIFKSFFGKYNGPTIYFEATRA
jgi:2-polyprenyl-3-methyl-5-hydroxy-6-metoxy-1,4-benzoquinol methylase